MSFVVVVLIALLVVGLVGTGIAFAVALARDSQRSVASGREVLPGVDTGAPTAWAGAHSPEARMHRRLGDAVGSLQAIAATGQEDVAGLELRVELEQHAVALDRRLVAAAALPVGARERALAELEVSVSTVEAAAGDLAVRIGSAGASSDVHGLEDLAARIQGLDGPVGAPELPADPTTADREAEDDGPGEGMARPG